MRQEWFTTPELAMMDLPSLSADRFTILRLAKRECWVDRTLRSGEPAARRRDGSKATEYHFSALPASAWRELARRGFFEIPTIPKQDNDNANQSAEAAALWERYSEATDAKKARAQARLKALGVYRDLQRTKGCNATTAKKIVVNEFCGQMKISLATLSNWLKRVRGVKEENWLPLLIDGYKGRAKQKLHPDDWSYFKGLYLKQTRPPVTACFEKMVQHAERNGRAISVDVRTVTRWVGDLEKDLVIAMREGPEAARLSKPSQKRSVAHLEAMEHLNADGHVWDFMVKWRDGSISRPTFAVLQDIYSRKILGWRMAKTESSEIVRLAIRDTFETYGLPRCVTFDNGSAWINKHLTAHASSFRYVGEDKPDDSPGLMAIANVQVKFAKPGRGQSKPIERAFGDMEKYMRAEPICDGAWVGYSPDNKPENAGTHAVPEDTFHALAEQIIDQHNARLGRKTEMGQGKHSFDNVFYESLHSGRSTVREAPRTMLDLFLLSRLERKVNNRNAAITIEGTDYWHEKMGNYRQQKVSVLYNPENLAASVIILDHEGRKICEAAPQGMVAFDSVGAAAAQRAKDNAYQRHLKALQDAENIMPLHELIKRSPIKNVVTPEALKDAKVIQGPFTAKAARTPEQSQKTGTDGGNVDAEYLSNLLAGLRKKSTAKET